MDSSLILILTQDGITAGAVYALLAAALVLVFAVTRVIFIPQGEYVAYGALTIAAIQSGHPPATAWLACALGAAVFALEVRERWHGAAHRLWPAAMCHLAFPLVLLGAVHLLPLREMGLVAQIAISLAIVATLGPAIYRLAYRPLAQASVLVLLIVSVAVHFMLLGLGLAMFGPEGVRSAPLSGIRLAIGPLALSGQVLVVMAASALVMTGLWTLFNHTVAGKALHATAVNPLGARLVGIDVRRAGSQAFFLAALIGATSGVLIGPTTTVYYDSGFLIGLKGFVAAIIGGLASFPLAAAGSLLVGLLESFASFSWSAYKEVLVFTLIIPVLAWRSIGSHSPLDEEDAA